MLKKDIIALLKTHAGRLLTIGFKGLTTTQAVDDRRKAMIDDIRDKVDNYNRCRDTADAVTMTVDKGRIKLSNGNFVFLPHYPKIGKLQVRSKDYIIGGCFCSFSDILPDTYTADGSMYTYKTKAGSVVIIPNFI